jgi:hypothetical protein
MPFCPVCRKSFSSDLKECPDDHVSLVDELPYQAVPSEDGTTWVEIASTGSIEEANLLQGFLQAEGIDAQIENVEPSIAPTTFGALGDIRVYVQADEEEAALRLLKHREEEYAKLDDDAETLVTDEGESEIDENASPENE